MNGLRPIFPGPNSEPIFVVDFIGYAQCNQRGALVGVPGHATSLRILNWPLQDLVAR